MSAAQAYEKWQGSRDYFSNFSPFKKDNIYID